MQFLTSWDAKKQAKQTGERTRTTLGLWGLSWVLFMQNYQVISWSWLFKWRYTFWSTNMQKIFKIAEPEESWEIGEWEEGPSRLAQVRGRRVTNEAADGVLWGKGDRAFWGRGHESEWWMENSSDFAFFFFFDSHSVIHMIWNLLCTCADYLLSIWHKLGSLGKGDLSWRMVLPSNCCVGLSLGNLLNCDLCRTAKPTVGGFIPWRVGLCCKERVMKQAS